MIRGTAKPIITSSGMSSSEYEAAVVAFIRAKGVISLPDSLRHPDARFGARRRSRRAPNV
jgi:hypothetical protein